MNFSHKLQQFTFFSWYHATPKENFPAQETRPIGPTTCLWGLSPQINQVEAKKVGQWNTAKIVQQDGKIQFYLNGKLTAQEDLTSNDWKNKVAGSGFKNSPAFGKATHGKIALQNWYFEAWFRNMKIREL